jgi:hypothetical protein
MKVHGRCHCGSIAYEAEIDPARVVGVSLLGLPDASPAPRFGVSVRRLPSRSS